jgi:ankyrin repeat protein
METDHYLPLHRAILAKDVVSIGRLLRRAVDINEVDHLNQSPLILAIKSRLTTIVLVLFDQGGLRIHQKDCLGKTALHYAMENNDCISMTHLLARGADVNTSCSFKRTPLIVASTCGFQGLVKRLVKEPGLLINHADHLGSTALWHASDEGHPSIVRVLMGRNANTNAMDSLKKTPLIAAAEKGHILCVQALLACDAIRVDHRDKWGFNALYYAFKKNFTETAKELVLRGGACLRYKTPLEHKTLLMVACQNGNFDLVRLCLTHDRGLPPVNAMDSAHRSALYYACKTPEIVSLLLYHLAVPGYMDISGKTPVMRAAELGSEEVVEMLVACKVDLDMIDYEGMTALAYACLFGKLEAARVLMRAGASPLISDMDDKTPLMLATIHGHYEIIVFLLEQDGDIGLDYRDFLGYTALQHASIRGHADSVAALLRKGALTIPDSAGVTPLMLSCKQKNVECTRLLLPHSEIEIDARDERGKTALVYACGQKGNLACVQLLLEHDADPGVQTEYGCTALMEAIHDGGSPELVQILLDVMTVPQINTQERNGDTALTIACAESFEIVCLLLNKGADPFKKCYHQATPVMVAASLGNAEIVEELAKRTGRYHLDSVDIDHLTALYHASVRGHTSVVRTLVAYGADATISSGRGNTPLIVAAEQGSLGIVVELVMSVRSISDRLRYLDKGNNALVTPLYQSACFGLTDTVDFLLRHGATQFTQDINGDTPLIGACLSKRTDMVQRLLESATLAEVNHVNHMGRSALYYAISSRNSTMLGMLHAAGASLKPLFATGAIWTSGYPDRLSLEMLRILTDTFQLNINAQDRYGRTALYTLAVTNGTEKRVAHLLNRNANPWLTPLDGVLAINKAPNAMVRFLLENAMQEHVRLETLDMARTLFHMEEWMRRASYATKTRDAKRLKSISVAPLVLKERLLLGKKLPTYTANAAPSWPLVHGVLAELIRCPNDDVFRELHEMMAVPWEVVILRTF